MSDIHLKSQVAKKWHDNAWERTFDPFYEEIWERVLEQHLDRISYDVAGRQPPLQPCVGGSCKCDPQCRESLIDAELHKLVDAEIEHDDSAALDAYMKTHYETELTRIQSEYFCNYRVALDGAAPEAECWKVLGEYGITSDNLLEAHPE